MTVHATRGRVALLGTALSGFTLLCFVVSCANVPTSLPSPTAPKAIRDPVATDVTWLIGGPTTTTLPDGRIRLDGLAVAGGLLDGTRTTDLLIEGLGQDPRAFPFIGDPSRRGTTMVAYDDGRTSRVQKVDLRTGAVTTILETRHIVTAAAMDPNERRTIVSVHDRSSMDARGVMEVGASGLDETAVTLPAEGPWASLAPGEFESLYLSPDGRVAIDVVCDGERCRIRWKAADALRVHEVDGLDYGVVVGVSDAHLAFSASTEQLSAGCGFRCGPTSLDLVSGGATPLGPTCQGQAVMLTDDLGDAVVTAPRDTRCGDDVDEVRLDRLGYDAATDVVTPIESRLVALGHQDLELSSVEGWWVMLSDQSSEGWFVNAEGRTVRFPTSVAEFIGDE